MALYKMVSTVRREDGRKNKIIEYVECEGFGRAMEFYKERMRHLGWDIEEVTDMIIHTCEGIREHIEAVGIDILKEK